VATTRTHPRYLIGVGFALSEPDANWDINKPWVCCLLCGRVFQSLSDSRRRLWSEVHSRRSHTQAEHIALYQSGLTMTAEAAYRLAAFGIIPISDMVLNEEVASALLEAPAQIQQEVEH